MFKVFLVSLVVLASLQVLPTTNGFIVNIHKGIAGSSSGTAATPPAATAAAPAFNPNALIQAIQSTIASKLSSFQSLAGQVLQTKQKAIASQLSSLQKLAGQLVQQKQTVKQNLLKQLTAASSGAVSSVQNAIGGLSANKPVFTKTINFGFKHPFRPATTAAPVPEPESTTPGASITTTKQPGGYQYRRH